MDLLQCGSFMGCSPFGVDVLWHGLIHGLQSLWGLSALAWAYSWAAVPLGCTCSGVGPPLSMVPSVGVLLPSWSTSYCSDLGAFLAVSHSFCSLLSQSDIFCPFLNTFSERHHKHTWLAQLWSMMGLLLIQLEPSCAGHRAAPDLPPGHPCSALHYPNLASYTQHTSSQIS